MTSTGGFVPGASHRATCSTCGWRGDLFAQRGRADDQARDHRNCAKPVVFETATQATTDAEGEAAELRHLSSRGRSAAVADATAQAEARRRIDAALGDPEHQRALDAQIDRHLGARRDRPAGRG
jgi:hypothetical protein